MKITKLVHSCLLVESDKEIALFDPGSFSKEAVINHLANVKSIDYLVITHSHHDHLDEEVVSIIVDRWPNVRVAANEEVWGRLRKFDLRTADDKCQPLAAPHEALPNGIEPPTNTGWHFGDLTHPGDSLRFDESKRVLALPYVAPWGSTTAAVNLARNLKPKFVLPIHDWHLNEQARVWYRQLLENSLEKDGIKILNAEEVAIEV